ncbi:hypothetical protein ACFLYR_04435 [Chloroflexota bacterium]
MLGLLTSYAKDVPIWVIVTIAGCFALEGIRHFVQVVRLRRHVRKFEQAEIEHRLGIVEKPSWERKRNKETKIGDRIYHPVQRDPGGIWLQIASTQNDIQSQVLLVSDVQKLIHNSVEFHNSQHRREVAIEAALGVVFIASGAFVSIAYCILNLEF